MARCDLHVHSKYSDHPSEWFLQRLGTAESYTEPEAVYRAARGQGMDFVTITDHNDIRGVLELKASHPHEVFTGVEATAYFPEDDCKVHLLIYDFTEAQFEEIQRLRSNIYLLRDFLRDSALPYSLAHATYSVNGTVRREHLEKLLLLFDCFEGVNGAQNCRTNSTWISFLESLTTEDIERLRDRHAVEPWGPEPWSKGITGGSDDHAGLFIGRTWTQSDSRTLSGFLSDLRRGNVTAAGRHNDFQSLAFSFYKVAYDFARSRAEKATPSPLTLLTELVFSEREFGLREKLASSWLKRKGGRDGSRLHALFDELLAELRGARGGGIESKLDIVYGKAADFSDELLGMLLRSLQKHLRAGSFEGLLRSFSAALPGVFLVLPFMSTFSHMYNDRHLVGELKTALGKKGVEEEQRILWFTDTLDDLNGVSVTLKEIGRIGRGSGYRLKLATSLTEGARSDELPADSLDLPALFDFPLPLYERYRIRIPSLLRALKEIYAYDPDLICVSTPGPLGLVGLLAARLMGVCCVGFYHTDFTAQVMKLVEDVTVASLVEGYVRRFYSALDEIRVPTETYRQKLAQSGYPPEKLNVFRRGVDTRHFAPRRDAARALTERYGIPAGFRLLYVGRISRDKGLDLLVEAYRRAAARREDLRLVLAGDGPDLGRLREECAVMPGAFCLGRIELADLPDLYSGCDLLVFPSETDTFGRVVLESQACGTPAVVTDVGGPRELVADGATGFVLPGRSVEAWEGRILKAAASRQADPGGWERVREAARRHVLENYRFEAIVEDLLERERPGGGRLETRTVPRRSPLLQVERGSPGTSFHPLELACPPG